MLDGFENVKVPPDVLAKKIMEALDIKPTDKVLEVGCGAGMLARHIAPNCQYYGIDITNSLLTKHRKLLDNDVIHAEANNIPFKWKFFDKSFSYSVFHYFPNREYVKESINEMKRVTKGSIFIGDLPRVSNRREHLLFDEKEIADELIYGIISKGYHDKNRFNVLKCQKCY